MLGHVCGDFYSVWSLSTLQCVLQRHLKWCFDHGSGALGPYGGLRPSEDGGAPPSSAVKAHREKFTADSAESSQLYNTQMSQESTLDASVESIRASCHDAAEGLGDGNQHYAGLAIGRYLSILRSQ